jgi:hypothetical protein
MSRVMNWGLVSNSTARAAEANVVSATRRGMDAKSVATNNTNNAPDVNESARKTLRTAAREENRPVMMLMMLIAALDAMATEEEDEKHAGNESDSRTSGRTVSKSAPAAKTGKIATQTCEHVDEDCCAAKVVELHAEHAAVGGDDSLGLDRHIFGRRGG